MSERLEVVHPSTADLFVYGRPIEIRFGDTDAMGHVNNAAYVTYFEAGRAGYFKAVTGRGFEDTLEEAASVVVASLRIDYRAPAFFGEGLELACRTTWAGRSSFGMAYRLSAAADARDGPGRLVAEGDSVQVFVERRSGRATRLPADFLALVAAFEGRPIPPRPAAG
ncbi:MAG TPA: thioesterase family protein [Candidatus Limnocylindrales bacterium]|jgi:acyl-CoA thioester hydrolase|nr:thioesterase family protein [Candidatus Limnocylindrales bacterium]